MSHTILFSFPPSTPSFSSCSLSTTDICPAFSFKHAPTRTVSSKKRIRTPTSNVTTSQSSSSSSSSTPIHKDLPTSTASTNLSTSVNSLSTYADSSDWRGILRIYDVLEKNYHPADLPPRLYTHVFFALMKMGGEKSAQIAWTIWKRVNTSEGAINVLLSPRSFNFLHVLLSRAAMVDQALKVREVCHQSGYYLNRYSYNAFLNACAKSGRVDDAFDTLKHMAENNVSPDVVSCNVLISCCVKSGHVDVALTVLERMKNWGIPPDIYSYNSVVNGLRKSKMLDDAFALVKHMEAEADAEAEQLKVTVSNPDGQLSENTSISDQFTYSKEYPDRRDGVNSRNRHVSEKSNPLRKQVTAVSPDLVTYNTLISGIASLQEPNFPRALAVKRHIEARGLQCNEVTYNSLMAVAARADRPDDAFFIYDEMASRGLKPNCECYTTLITMCGRAGLKTRAFELHEHMVNSGISPSVVTFNALLTVCRRSEGQEAGNAALQILSVMRQTPGCNPDVITYSTVIDALGKDGRFEEVVNVLNEMTQAGIPPNLVTYTSMVSAFVRARDLPGAMNVLKQMERNGIEPNVYTFSSLINGAGRLGEFEKAIDILNMMKSRGIQANRITYSALIQLAVKTGNKDYISQVITHLLKDDRVADSPEAAILAELRQSRSPLTSSRKKVILQEILSVIVKCFPEKKDTYMEKRNGN